MPDHVHMLLCPSPGTPLNRVMKGIKGVTARKLNKQRGTRGAMWQDEYYDRIVRDNDEFVGKLQYMFHNPLGYGLVEDPLEYDGWYMKEVADNNVCPTNREGSG
jgi:REP element-mobilizing transposase RayT